MALSMNISTHISNYTNMKEKSTGVPILLIFYGFPKLEKKDYLGFECL